MRGLRKGDWLVRATRPDDAKASYESRSAREQRPAATRGVRGRQDGAQSTKVELIPWVQADASGLTLVGVF
jgi:hypothetical protein